MSAAYADARAALGIVDEVVHEEPDSVPTSTYALLGIGRALLALGEELEAMVELLRERLQEPGERPDMVAAYRKGREDERAGIYRPASCTCVIAHPGTRPEPLPDEWREDCPAHPERPA